MTTAAVPAAGLSLSQRRSEIGPEKFYEVGKQALVTLIIDYFYGWIPHQSGLNHLQQRYIFDGNQNREKEPHEKQFLVTIGN